MSHVLGNSLQTQPYGKWSTLSTASKTIRLIDPYGETPDSVYGYYFKRGSFLGRTLEYHLAIKSTESRLSDSNSKIKEYNQKIAELRPFAEGPDHPEDYRSTNFKIAQYEGRIISAEYNIAENQEKITKLKLNAIKNINKSIAYLNNWVAQCTEDLAATIEAEECNKGAQKNLCDSIMQCTAAIQKDMMQLNYFESNA